MPETTDEQAEELRAAIGLLGHQHGFRELPTFDPDADAALLPPIDRSVEVVANAQHLHPALRLELLARTVRAREVQESLIPVDLRGLAESLLDREATVAPRRPTGTDLLDRLASSVEGRDPLSRTVADLIAPDDLVQGLHADIQTTLLTVLPRCAASVSPKGGVPALNIVTERTSYKPLGEYRTVVDPREWPECWLQHAFFKRMDVLGGPTPTTFPDAGWSARLLETVDFGFGLGPPQEARTRLDFVYFANLAPRAPATGPAVGCTYDFAGSEDGRISIDQGYLLAEDVPHPAGSYRRYRTHKMVHFTNANPFPDPDAGNVCSFWSLAAGIIEQGC